VSDVRKKNSKCRGKKIKCFEKKMNDKRNSICGNVMLLSQSRDEIFFVCFCKKMFGLKIVFNPKIAD
jgi:hypothetical protein